MNNFRLDIPKAKLSDFCRKWKVREFALFGSALREDFRPESDVDVLVSFDPAADWSLLEIAMMQEELQEIFGREVDLLEKEALRNPFRRHEILSTMEVIHAE